MAARAKKAKQYQRELTTEIGNLRELADRMGTVLMGLSFVESLLEAVEQDNPNVKHIAEIVRRQMDNINEAMSGQSDEAD